jgi:hypothetical protein
MEKCGNDDDDDGDDVASGCAWPNVLISFSISAPAVKYLRYCSSYALFVAITFSRQTDAPLTHFTKFPNASGESSRPNSNRVPVFRDHAMHKNGSKIREMNCVENAMHGGNIKGMMRTCKRNDRNAQRKRDLGETVK